MKKDKGKWLRCENPKCGEGYHIDEKKIVDKPCSCKKRALQNMREFASEASSLVIRGV